MFANHVFVDAGLVVGDELLCRAEFLNIHDPYATAVLKMGFGLGEAVNVGHVPRNISAVCHCFMKNCEAITRQVIGGRRYSTDLSQVGLEVPCTYTFVGCRKYVEKVRRLLNSMSPLL